MANYNALGQAIDTTWGRSSTPNSANFSIKCKILGTDSLLVTYIAVVNFQSQKQQIEMKRKYNIEAVAAIESAIVQIAKTYKELMSGETIKFTKNPNSEGESIEYLNSNPHNTKKTCLFKKHILFKF